MKKIALFVIALLTLTSCSPSPEDTFSEALDLKSAELQLLWEKMEHVGSHLEQSQFWEWVAKLKEVSELASSISVGDYTGADTNLKTVSSELKTGLKEIVQLADILLPIMEKWAANQDYVLSTEEEATMKKSEELIKSIETRFTKMWTSLDTYNASIEQASK